MTKSSSRDNKDLGTTLIFVLPSSPNPLDSLPFRLKSIAYIQPAREHLSTTRRFATTTRSRVSTRTRENEVL